MGRFKIKKTLPLLILPLFLPVLAFGAISISPSTITTCPTGECAIPVTLSCSPQTSDIVVALWDGNSLSVQGTCDTLNGSDISSWLDWATGGSQQTIAYCDSSVVGSDCSTHTDLTAFVNDSGYLGSVDVLSRSNTSLFGAKLTASAVVSNIGGVSKNTFNSTMPYIATSIGVFIAFYIMQRLAHLTTQEKGGTKNDGYIRDKNGKRVGVDMKGYHRIYGKSKQEIGWEKD